MKIQMTMPEAQSLLNQHQTRPDGHAGNLYDHAKQMVDEAKAEQIAQEQWDNLRFYQRWWLIAVEWMTTPIWWIIPRWAPIAVAILLVVFLGIRVKVNAPRTADPVEQAATGDPGALEQPGNGVPPQGDPWALLQQTPTANPDSLLPGTVVECTAATCPDAEPFLVNYQGKSGPAGSATLREKCEKGSPILGEIPKGTIVWVITSSINQGTFCENGECRRGMIKPVLALKFTWKSGCVSFTALQPVEP